jgi:hemoglobin-like flavoprotein
MNLPGDMTEEEKQLVRATFAKAERISEIVGLAFYQHLFTLDPGLQPLFRNDIGEQSKKLMATLKMAVDGLDRPRELIPVIQALGRRHLQYGVKDEHYDLVGAALLWTLEHALGSDFTPTARNAWGQVYVWLATTMKEAAAHAVASFDTTRFMAPSTGGPKQ